MSEILGDIYIWMFLVNNESGLLLALVKYMLCNHFTQTIFLYFWRLKILVLWLKIVENLLMFVYLFFQKNDAIDFSKTFITQEWLVVESCPTSRWIAFLMLYRLVYNKHSHFNELILAWSANSQGISGEWVCNKGTFVCPMAYVLRSSFLKKIHFG